MCEPEYPAEKLKPYRDEAWKCLGWVAFWLMLAIGVLVLSSIPGLFPASQTNAQWFQRSGSITTIGALVIGLFVTRLRDNLQGRSIGSLYGQHVFKEIRIPYRIAAVSTVACTILGTIVWGYGDLLLDWYRQP
jgi:hypothetical protein